MPPANIQLKAEIVQGPDSILRRATCPGDWGTVRGILNEWAGNDCDVQYTDTDGDVVSVSSEWEWNECVRTSPQPPLRLRCIGGGKKPRSQRGAAPPAEAAQSAPGGAESRPAESPPAQAAMCCQGAPPRCQPQPCARTAEVAQNCPAADLTVLTADTVEDLEDNDAAAAAARGSTVSERPSTPPAARGTPPSPEVLQLLELGLCDEGAAAAALVACGGNVQKAAAALLR
eukprot:TRINITY_DN1809_c0_g1_i2.p1 TRINITY_DN1809_c0_g1~~TRINITY_DN1809_c0_g1_i2.p1  ORF type:complete len:230 (+),score=49.02 TRINITY_DN1809_c0_g1_i2:56-745(+)